MDSNVDIKERERVFRICSTNLDGAWKSCSLTDLEICRLSGGMTNLLYSCTLPEICNSHYNQIGHREAPRSVLVRIYGSTDIDLEVQLEVFNQLASENLGPKLYATFEGGRIEELLTADPLSLEQLQDRDISACIAKKLAAAHCLNVKSLHNDPNWLIDKFGEFHRLLESIQSRVLSTNGHVSLPPSSKRTILRSTLPTNEQILALNLKVEIDYVSQLINQSKSPLVFSHNDLHQKNILLSRDSRQLQSLDDRVILIDFEYCSFNYQPYDLANHLSEWSFDYNLEEYPFFRASVDWFPSTDQQKQFLSHYVDELNRRLVDNTSNSSLTQKSLLTTVETLHEELQPFLMVSNLFWCIWAIGKAFTSEINFGYWEMAQAKWDIYLMCKQGHQKRVDDKNKNNRNQGDTQVQSKM